jgi:hypothetical protein
MGNMMRGGNLIAWSRGEMVNALRLERSAFGLVGSNPTGTTARLYSPTAEAVDSKPTQCRFESD